MVTISKIDKLISHFDRFVRHQTLQNESQTRPSPANTVQEQALNTRERKRSISMMRVNHSGEVCAQALYHGQAFMAQTTQQYAALIQAANEENDHLNWCKQRLVELNAKTSVLNPVWYAGSFAIGALAGLGGDKISLGFLAETERQVTQHLDDHLAKIAKHDFKSRAIIQQMRAEEIQHAIFAEKSGAANLPLPIKVLMRCTAKIMTVTATKI